MTTREKIIAIAKDLRLHDPQGGWFTRHDICGKNYKGYFVPVGADNRIRDLVKEGILERKHGEQYMNFRFVMPEVAVRSLNYQNIITANEN